jgi:hypothetical protein
MAALLGQRGVCVTDEENETPAYLTVIEDGDRPAANSEGLPLFRRLSKMDCLEFAAELAADMETGYYIPEGATEPWPKRRFNIAEILRRMGYGATYVENARRPAWWPEGGTQAFKGYVEWKVRERAMLGRVTFEKLAPFLEALTVAGFAEMARRIKLDPKSVPFRDLAQFTMRVMDAIRGQADPWKGEMSPGGADAYQRISQAIDAVGDDTARKAIEALLDATLVAARARMRSGNLVAFPKVPEKETLS